MLQSSNGRKADHAMRFERPLMADIVEKLGNWEATKSVQCAL
jgi:hypothetical protein